MKGWIVRSYLKVGPKTIFYENSNDALDRTKKRKVVTRGVNIFLKITLYSGVISSISRNITEFSRM
jgi:hypothetical protein